MPLHHFLLVFDLDRQELVGEPRQFADPTEAAAAYAALEGKHRGDRNLEIVLIGADSLDTIRHTHPNYFGEPSTSQYLTAIR
ncbi:MAG: hypothetical protein IT201_09470 [Thermoleophilia bacterium]|nr:hypothetical protein [Thermoleophilia bacterium]